MYVLTLLHPARNGAPSQDADKHAAYLAQLVKTDPKEVRHVY